MAAPIAARTRRSRTHDSTAKEKGRRSHAGPRMVPPYDLSVLVAVVVVVPVPTSVVDVHRDASLHAAADLLSDSRRIAARSDNGEGRHLRHEDQVARGVCGHRVRVLRL